MTSQKLLRQGLKMILLQIQSALSFWLHPHLSQLYFTGRAASSVIECFPRL